MIHRISLESDAIVVTVGHSGSGKTTFLNQHFFDHQTVSMDETVYSLVGHYDLENYYFKEAMHLLATQIDVRASIGLLTVVDTIGSRGVLERIDMISRKHDRPLYALIFPHLSGSEMTYERLGNRFFYKDLIEEQIQCINELSLPERFNYIVISKEERKQYQIKIKEEENHELNPNYNWIVVPDIHGNYSVIQNQIKQKTDDDKIIFLGDLADRGPSTYLSFLWVKKMVENNQGIWIKGNHDQKLFSYFYRWLNDPQRQYELNRGEHYPGYSININSGGMKSTLKEFFNLSPSAMLKYAEEYVNLYDEHSNVRYYSFLKRGNEVHFFAHANITNNIIRQKSLTENDRNTCLYRKLKFDYERKIWGLYKSSVYDKVYIHLGHEVMTPQKIDQFSIKDESGVERIKVLKHDQGIGKNEFALKDLEKFYIL